MCKLINNRYIIWYMDIKFLLECLIYIVFDVMWKKENGVYKKV